MGNTVSLTLFTLRDGQGDRLPQRLIFDGQAANIPLSFPFTYQSFTARASPHVLSVGWTDEGCNGVFTGAWYGPVTNENVFQPSRCISINNVNANGREAFVNLAVETGFQREYVEMFLTNATKQTDGVSVALRKDPVKALEYIHSS